MFKHIPRLTHRTYSSPSGGTTMRASVDHDDTAQPSLTSGFGTVMEMEQDMRTSTEAELGRDSGPKSAAIDRILRQHLLLLDANFALLAQRYEMLPNPKRFAAVLAAEGRPNAIAAAAAPGSAGWLSELVAQHLDLGRAIGALIGRQSDGQRGELILTEIARYHEQMAWMLTALVKEDAAHDAVSVPVIASRLGSPAPREAEADWENEGGASTGRR